MVDHIVAQPLVKLLNHFKKIVTIFQAVLHFENVVDSAQK